MGHRFEVAEEAVVGVSDALIDDAHRPLRQERCEVRARTLVKPFRADLAGARSRLELEEERCLKATEVFPRGL